MLMFFGQLQIGAYGSAYSALGHSSSVAHYLSSPSINVQDVHGVNRSAFGIHHADAKVPIRKG